jgi:hypothetical protein
VRGGLVLVAALTGAAACGTEPRAEIIVDYKECCYFNADSTYVREPWVAVSVSDRAGELAGNPVTIIPRVIAEVDPSACATTYAEVRPIGDPETGDWVPPEPLFRVEIGACGEFTVSVDWAADTAVLRAGTSWVNPYDP